MRRSCGPSSITGAPTTLELWLARCRASRHGACCPPDLPPIPPASRRLAHLGRRPAVASSLTWLGERLTPWPTNGGSSAPSEPTRTISIDTLLHIWRSTLYGEITSPASVTSPPASPSSCTSGDAGAQADGGMWKHFHSCRTHQPNSLLVEPPMTGSASMPAGAGGPKHRGAPLVPAGAAGESRSPSWPRTWPPGTCQFLQLVAH